MARSACTVAATVAVAVAVVVAVAVAVANLCADPCGGSGKKGPKPKVNQWGARSRGKS
jgi:hypothetical protein